VPQKRGTVSSTGESGCVYRVVIDGEGIAVGISLIAVGVSVASLRYSQKNRDVDIWNRFMGNQAMLAITIAKFTENTLPQYLICKYGNNASKQLADVERDLDESMASFATILEAVPPKHDAVKKLMLEINNQVQIIRSRSDNQDFKVSALVKAVAMMCLLDVLFDYARDSKLQDYSNSSVNNKIKQEAEALDACRIERKINYLCQKNKSIKIVFELDDFKVADHGDVIGEAWVAHIKTLNIRGYRVRSDYLKKVYKELEGEFDGKLKLVKKVKKWFRR